MAKKMTHKATMKDPITPQNIEDSAIFDSLIHQLTGSGIRKGMPKFLVDHRLFMKQFGCGNIKLTAKHNDYNIWTSFKVDGQEFELYGYCKVYDCPVCGFVPKLGKVIIHDKDTIHPKDMRFE